MKVNHNNLSLLFSNYHNNFGGEFKESNWRFLLFAMLDTTGLYFLEAIIEAAKETIDHAPYAKTAKLPTQELERIISLYDELIELVTQSTIFLDVDGVLTTHTDEVRVLVKGQLHPFNQSCVSVLNDIIEEVKPCLVLTSSWRNLYSYDDLEENFFQNQVCTQPIAVTGTTPNNDRYAEIMEFVEKYNIPNYVILDSNSLYNFPESHFIKTDPAKGLQKEHMPLIINKLKGDT